MKFKKKTKLFDDFEIKVTSFPDVTQDESFSKGSLLMEHFYFTIYLLRFEIFSEILAAFLEC